MMEINKISTFNSLSNIVHSVEKYEGKDVRLANNGNQKEKSPISPYPDLYHPDHQTQQDKLLSFSISKKLKDTKDREPIREAPIKDIEELDEKITTTSDPEKQKGKSTQIVDYVSKKNQLSELMQFVNNIGKKDPNTME